MRRPEKSSDGSRKLKACSSALDAVFDGPLNSLGRETREAVVPIDIRDVAAFYAANGEAGWNVADFPCIASPFKQAWYETPESCFARWDNTRAARWFDVERWGWMFLTWESGFRAAKGCHDALMDAADPMRRHISPQEAAELERGIRASNEAASYEVGFMQFVYGFGLLRSGEIHQFMSGTMSLSPEGRYIADEEAGGFSLCGPLAEEFNDPEISADERKKATECILSRLGSAFLAISFLHCKNVTLVDRPIPEKVRRRRAARGYSPGTQFKELRVEPMRKILRTEGRSDEVGLKRALHICRGHFATYTEDKPLFGRTVGTFWVPAHVRGTKDAGEVRKSYKVEAPRAT
jgi:hypothetical protein